MDQIEEKCLTFLDRQDFEHGLQAGDEDGAAVSGELGGPSVLPCEELAE